MNRACTGLTVALAAAFLASCRDASSPDPSYSRQATVVTVSAARGTDVPLGYELMTTLSDATAPAITSDGRGVYNDGDCGAFGNLNVLTGDALMDPDRLYKSNMFSSCKTARQFHFVFSSAVQVDDGSYATAGGPPGGIASVTSDSGTVERRLQFQMAGTVCDFLQFGYRNVSTDTSSRVLVTSDVGGWMVESKAPHSALCVKTVGKETTRTYYKMPFRLHVTRR